MSRNLRQLISLGQVIAERELIFERPGQQPLPVHVKVGLPIRDPAHLGNYLCPVVILGFDKEEKLVLGGVDALQALTFALQALAGFLQVNARQRLGSFSWLGSTDLGLV